MEDSRGHRVEKMVVMEPSTLQWPEDRQTGSETGKEDRTSVRSDVLSCTESEGEKRGQANEKEGVGPMTQLEEEEEVPVENELPAKAAQVFSPAVTVLQSPSSPRESEAFWEMESEKSPFLGSQGVPQDYNHHGYRYDCIEDTPPTTCKYTIVFQLRAVTLSRWGSILSVVFSGGALIAVNQVH